MLVLPTALYAPIESGLSQKTAHELNTLTKGALQAALREPRSAAYDYLFVPVKDGGMGCVNVQQERLAAMAQELQIALNQPGLKGEVYRDRWKSAVCGNAGRQSNFVAGAIEEVAEYGVMVRFRGNELVARTLDALAARVPVWRSATRSWTLGAWNGTSFYGRLFADTSPLGAFLHRQVLLRGEDGRGGGRLRNQDLRMSKELRAILRSRGYKQVVSTDHRLLSAVDVAYRQLQSDYRLERRMSVSGRMSADLLPGQERAQWRGVGRIESVGGDRHDVRAQAVKWRGQLHQCWDQWADLADAVPPEAQLDGVWAASDGARHECDQEGRPYVYGCGGVFVRDPRLDLTANCDDISANCECRRGSNRWRTCGKRKALHSHADVVASFAKPVPERVGANATSPDGVSDVASMSKKSEKKRVCT